MSQEPTLRQRVNAKILELNEDRQRIAAKAAEIDVLQVEYQTHQEELKALIAELSPNLATEIFDNWQGT